MAESREGPLKIHLVHGAKNHTVTLSLSDSDCSDVVGVSHLAAAAFNISGIPPDKQKLIFKGKTLNQSMKQSESLRSFGLKDGSKVMLLGTKPAGNEKVDESVTSCDGNNDLTETEPPDPHREDKDKLQRFESLLAKQVDDLDSIIKRLDKITRRRTKSSNETAELEDLKKQLLRAAEGFMRLLESLDSLRFQLTDSCSRGKRKAIVDQIQRLMDQCDELSSSVTQKLSAKK